MLLLLLLMMMMMMTVYHCETCFINACKLKLLMHFYFIQSGFYAFCAVGIMLSVFPSVCDRLLKVVKMTFYKRLVRFCR